MSKRALVAGLVVLAVSACAHAGALDIIGPYLNGEYWFGYLDASRPYLVSYSVHAEVEVAPGGITATSTDCEGDTDPRTVSLTGAAFDGDGWLNLDLTIDSVPLTMQAAVYEDMLFTVMRTPDPYDNLGLMAALRRDRTITSTAAAGDYACFVHAVGYTNTQAVAKYGTLTLASDMSYGASLNCSSGTTETPAGMWSIAEGELTLAPAGGTAQVIGAGPQGVMMDFDIDTSDAYLGYELIIKKGTGRTVSEAVGQWLVQAWYTADNIYPRTVWGTAEILPDGSYSISLSDVDGGSAAITGMLTMDGDGIVHCTDTGTGRTRDGVLAMGSDMLVLSDLDPNADLGMTVFIRVIPEPVSLAMLAVGALVILRRRR